MEGVEDQLAGEAEQIEGAATVLGDEAARGGEVLAGHDLGGFAVEYSAERCRAASRLERPVDVAQLFVGIAGLSNSLTPA